MVVLAWILIGITLTWILWHRLREINLAADLDEMRGDLFDRALARGCLGDPAYTELDKVMRIIAKRPMFISLPMMIRAFFDSDRPGPGRKQSQNAEFDEILLEVWSALGSRLFRFILKETVIGWIMGLLALLWPDDHAGKSARLTAEAAQRVVSDNGYRLA
jgi:hypothetical protein